MDPSRLELVVTTNPNRTRGCAEVGGTAIVIAVAPPSKFSQRKLARIFEHELTHILGLDHHEMPEPVLWSRGGTPEWARDLPLRWDA